MLLAIGHGHCQEAYDFACLFISHDLGAVEQVADRVFVMEGGRVVEAGERDTVFDQPQHDYTRRLLAASPALSVAGDGFELQPRSRAAASRSDGNDEVRAC